MCIQDVFLLCGTNRKYYQIWINNKSDGFKMARTGAFPPNIGPVSFADMGTYLEVVGVSFRLSFCAADRDGTIDMIFPSCDSISTSTGIGTNCKINIAYNQQKPLCASASPAVSQKNCRLPDSLCSADSEFKFDFTENTPVCLEQADAPFVPHRPLTGLHEYCRIFVVCGRHQFSAAL